MTPERVLVVVVAALLVIAAAQGLAPRVRLAAPLLLVLVGVAVGEVPAAPTVQVEPEWIISGVLPPLLYASAVSMPAMDFRREFTAIGSLSILLVLLTTAVSGLFFAWAIPGLSLAWGLALGAIVSPTDAVATSIVKALGAPGRVVTMLDGESLLNDATALVILRSAIAATTGAVTVPGVLGDFLFAVAVAVAIGVAAGHANLWLRARTADATVSTVISFTVPFAAALPAEALGASGLVAAVVAGLVTGRRAPRVLPPRHRLSDGQNWRTVELVLEGGVFLLLGLQLGGILDAVSGGFGTAVAVAVGGLALTLVARLAYVAPLLRRLGRRAARGESMRPRLAAAQETFEADGTVREAFAVLVPAAADGSRRRGSQRRVSERHADRFRTRVRRTLADVDALLANPLGPRDGALVVWAGMRGAVTLAAAQTLPEDAPARETLVLVAFLVATGSLLLQGGSLGWVVRRLGVGRPSEEADGTQRAALMEELRAAAAAVPAQEDRIGQRLAQLHAQRTLLLDARDDGLYPSDALAAALDVVDADEISVGLRGDPPASQERGTPTGGG